MPPSKKIRTTTGNAAASGAQRTARMGRGRLQDLPDLAVEIQLEIFGNLHPRDLLNLARTCRKFRAFFLHRTNERLWHAARENAGPDLPPCPPFMSEPAFMNLLFGTCCQNCGHSNVRRVQWAWFIRYCLKCASEMSYSYYDAQTAILQVDHHRVFIDYDGGEDEDEDDQDDEEDEGEPLLKLFGGYLTQQSRYQHYRLLRSHVDTFVDKLEQIPKPISEQARSQLIKKQRACTADRAVYAKQCLFWYGKQQAARATTLDVKRSERFTEIVRRLRELGWDQDIDFLDQWGLREMSELAVVRQSSKLTPKSWENVLKAVDPFLKRTRQERLDKERTDILHARFASLEAALRAHCVHLPRTAHMDGRPETVDIVLMPQCRALADAPNDRSVTQDDFAALVPTLVTRWMEERRQQFATALRKECEALELVVPSDVDVLDLAIAILPCTRCWSRDAPFAFYRYPTVLSHSCARALRNFYKNYERQSDLYRTAVVIRAREEGFDSTCCPFKFENMCEVAGLRRVLRFMTHIVKALGLDPARATAAELEACRTRLRCGYCVRYQSESKPLAAYMWEAALRHTCSEERYSHDQWEVADTSMEKAAFAGLDSEPPALVLTTPGAVWSCSLCVRWNGRADQVEAHLSDKHDITYSDDHIQDGTLYLHPGESTVLLRPAYTFPTELSLTPSA
ncbi:hypothetical protein C8Q76DRAFT_716480 [Earliella scabrosa]|nr:hypothetical protein C8Q76DRAFT_716480 [Earliella scabrosa]